MRETALPGHEYEGHKEGEGEEWREKRKGEINCWRRRRRRNVGTVSRRLGNWTKIRYFEGTNRYPEKSPIIVSTSVFKNDLFGILILITFFFFFFF